MAVDDYGATEERRVEIDGVPGRLLMGVDADGNKRFLRCDEDGYLICKVVTVEPSEVDTE